MLKILVVGVGDLSVAQKDPRSYLEANLPEGYVVREKRKNDSSFVVCLECNGAVEVAEAFVYMTGSIEFTMHVEDQVDTAIFTGKLKEKFGV